MGVTVAPQKNNRWTGPTDWNSRNKPGDQREREREKESQKKPTKRREQEAGRRGRAVKMTGVGLQRGRDSHNVQLSWAKLMTSMSE